MGSVIMQWDDPRPGYKWPVAVARKIRANTDQVWKAISTPGNLEKSHPFCASNPVQTWNEAESIDEIHYLNGLVFERKFCNWIEDVGYDLEIGRTEGQKSFVSWRIKSINNCESVLRIAVYPYILQNVAVAFRYVPHFLYVRPMLKKYLSSVVKGFEWSIIRKEPVPRNQFGVHPWFSVQKKHENPT